jgi:hypothetical protein
MDAYKSCVFLQFEKYTKTNKEKILFINTSPKPQQRVPTNLKSTPSTTRRNAIKKYEETIIQKI